MRAERHPFGLLASAIVGRPVYIAYLRDPDALAFADEAHIHVPLSSSPERQRNEILVQSLLLTGGSLRRSSMLGILGRPLLRQRYLVLEVERCAALYSERLPSSFLRLLADCRSGLAPTDVEHSLALARGLRKVPEPPPWFGTIHPMRALRNQGAMSGAALAASDLADIESQLRNMAQALQEAENDEDAVKDNLWQLFSSPLGKEGAISKLLRDLLDMSSSPDSSSAADGGGGAMEKVSARLVSRLRDMANALRTTTETGIVADFVLPEVGAHRYQEWDAGKQRYKPDWVTVEEVDAYSEAPRLSAEVAAATRTLHLQRALAGLCFNYQRHSGECFGDELVLDRLVELRASLTAGCSGDERVYRASLRTRRDLGVQILVDISSSTLEPSTPTKSICDLQLEAAWQLCSVFSQLGDRVAMHGFHSWGRALLRFQRIKSFDERIGASIEQRMRNLSIAGYTRSGAAIRHGATLLRRYSGMPCQLLLILSDGYPYDDQYEGNYAAEDTQKALQEVREQGMACVCISVGSDADSARLRKIYGDANYLAVDRPEKLVTHLRPVIDAAIASSLKRS